MIVVGLTGSMAMGKSETGKLFRHFGIPVFDSDAAVHDIYQNDAAVISAIRTLVPTSCVEGRVDRSELSRSIASNADLLSGIEMIVHPVVRSRTSEFISRCRREGRAIVVLDVPLLFETHQAGTVDTVLVVSAPPEVQRERILQRPGMTQKKLEVMLGRQLPDAEKRRLADYVVDTSKGLDDARRQVGTILASLSKIESSTQCVK